MADKEEKLTINRLKFELSLDERSEYNHFADRIARLSNGPLSERLQSVLSKLNLPNGKIVINRINLDLGKISRQYFEETIVNAIAIKFEELLKKYSKEIFNELKYAKFKYSTGRKFSITTSAFSFEAELYLEKTIDLKAEEKHKIQQLSSIKSREKALKESKEIQLDKILEKASKDYKKIDKVLIQDKAKREFEDSKAIDLALIQDRVRFLDKSTQDDKDSGFRSKLEDSISTAIDKDKSLAEKADTLYIPKADIIDVPFSGRVSQTEKGPKKLSELDEIVIYYLKYGRLPSNVKYELGTSLLEILKLNVRDDLYYDVLKKYAQEDERTKTRLISLSDDKIHKELIRKEIITAEELIGFNTKVPAEFVDLLIAYIHEYDTSAFSPIIKKFSINDLIRFIYADSPLELRGLLKYILLQIPSEKSTQELVQRLFARIGKGTVVKIIAAFIRKAGYVNIFLNDLNKINQKGTKDAHFHFFLAILKQQDPIKRLKELGFRFKPKEAELNLLKMPVKGKIEKLFTDELDYYKEKFILQDLEFLFGKSLRVIYQQYLADKIELSEEQLSLLVSFLRELKEIRKIEIEDSDTPEISERRFASKEPVFRTEETSIEDILDYFLIHGSVPYTKGIIQIKSLEELSLAFQSIPEQNLKQLKFYSQKLFLKKFRYEIVGQLSIYAIRRMIKVLAPSMADQAYTNYLNFEYNIKSGISESFQKAFLLYYSLLDAPKSYLEEMIDFWKAQIGDGDNVIKEKWKFSKEYQKELNTYLKVIEKPLTDKLKLDYEFQSYAEEISVKNAGLVILWPFLKIYFNLLGLLNSKGEFISIKEKDRACHLLQYLAVKRSEGEEFYYPLNKILTGFPLEEQLSDGIIMTEKEKDVSVALLKNVIKQWNALKNSSVDGLRGSFLIRDGILSPSTNGWKLTVEKKAYDILLDKLPWGIGMIKLSWIPYVIAVEWETKNM